MVEKLAELRQMSDDEVVGLYDRQAQNTSVGLNHYRDELLRRDQEKQTEIMLTYTRQIRWMTVVVTISTVINVIIAVLCR